MKSEHSRSHPGTCHVGIVQRDVASAVSRSCCGRTHEDKVNLLNNKKSPISDIEIEDLLVNKRLDFTATLDTHLTYKDTGYVVIAIPTDYDGESNYFNTSTVEAVIKRVRVINPSAVMELNLRSL